MLIALKRDYCISASHRQGEMSLCLGRAASAEHTCKYLILRAIFLSCFVADSAYFLLHAEDSPDMAKSKAHLGGRDQHVAKTSSKLCLICG